MNDKLTPEEALPLGLIAWYNFKENARALFITGGIPALEVLFLVLEDRGLQIKKVSINEVDKLNENDQYDYIIAAGVLEQTLEPTTLLEHLNTHLTPTGILLIAAFNRLNLGQFIGDKDITTGHALDGLDNYAQVNEKRMKQLGGHSYSKVELEEMLTAAGLNHNQFYSVYPSLKRPNILLAYGEQINERFDGRIKGVYNSPETVFLYKEKIYDDLMKNDLLHQMADGYLIECSINTQPKKALEITVQSGRSEESALATIVYTNRVIKKNMFAAGKTALQKIEDNATYLRSNNVPVISGKLTEQGYETDYIHGQLQTEYLQQLALKDKEEFLRELTKIQNIIYHSSPQVPYDQVDWLKFDPYWEKRKADDPEKYKWRDLANGTAEEKAEIGPILERGYLDLTAINCFMTEDGPLYFDQEFYVPNLPANAIFIRTIDFVYTNNPKLGQLLPQMDVLEHFNLYTHREIFHIQAAKYLDEFLNHKNLTSFMRRNQLDYNTVASNRFRIDYTQEEYERLFTDIFKDAVGKKMYLFGSGDYAQKFIEKYKDQYEIAGLIDNNKDKWDTELEGIRIYGPEQLQKEQSGFKVFICIKFYDEVLAQLKAMKINNIAIFNPWLDYPRPAKLINQQTKDAPPKKYHIGYVAGVFDMFHIGHLNLLKRAKEQCDYLIVGIVTDEQIMHNKKTRPVIPFNQRFAIVQGCRYVDEAVTIPMNNAGTEYAYRTYKFDAQFSGSDYADDPNWLATKEFLQSKGSDLVFFPYTEEISSTMLKEQLRGDEKR